MADIDRDLQVKDRDTNIRKWLIEELKIDAQMEFGAFLSDLEFMFRMYQLYEDAAGERKKLAEKQRSPKLQKLLLEKRMPHLAELFQDTRNAVKADFQDFIAKECKSRTGLGGSHLE